MPRVSIIRQDGTGDYTSLQAWIAAERLVDYGDITVARVDGFFDFGAVEADLGSSGFVNGARIEAFDNSIAFDGTRRQLCGFTSSSGGRTVRNRGRNVELEGLEIYNTGSGMAYWNTNSAQTFSASNCLFKNANRDVPLALACTVSGVLTNCVMDGVDRGYNDSGAFELVNCSVFANTGGAVSSIGSGIPIANTVTVNAASPSGLCYRPNDTLANTAATDATADTFNNIVVASNFISPDPVSSGDYRVDGTGPIGSVGIGAFVFAPGNQTVVSDKEFTSTLLQFVISDQDMTSTIRGFVQSDKDFTSTLLDLSQPDYDFTIPAQRVFIDFKSHKVKI